MLWSIDSCQKGYSLSSVTRLYQGLGHTTHGGEREEWFLSFFSERIYAAKSSVHGKFDMTTFLFNTTLTTS